MLSNCCFCISLKTATLSLAILGIASHFYSAFTLLALSDEFDNNDIGAVFGLATYSFFSGFACLAGAIGVFKNDIKHLQFFSIYYWIDLGLHAFFAVGSSLLIFSLDNEICNEIVNEMKDDVLDMNTCKSIYIQTAWIATLAMAISMLLKLHFAFAVYSYTQQVGREGQGESIHFEEQLIAVTYPTSYNEKEKPIFVAGKEFIVDEKKIEQ